MIPVYQSRSMLSLLISSFQKVYICVGFILYVISQSRNMLSLIYSLFVKQEKLNENFTRRFELPNGLLGVFRGYNYSFIYLFIFVFFFQL